jgi:signal transduction histidine kinase
MLRIKGGDGLKEFSHQPDESIKSGESLSHTPLASRHQFGISVVFVSVIPLLASLYLFYHAWADRDAFTLVSIVIVAATSISMAAGYIMLCRYPSNLRRVRNRLERIVERRLKEDMSVTVGVEDIPAIETLMQILVEQLSERVERVESEVGRVESLLNRSASNVSIRSVPDSTKTSRSPYLTQSPAASPNPGLMADTLGTPALASMLSEFLELTETAAAFYEKNGDFAVGMAASEWHRGLCSWDPGLFERNDPAKDGKDIGSEHAALSWVTAACQCVSQDDILDQQCVDGARLFFVPIRSRNEVVGAMGFGYGNTPKDPERIHCVASRYGMNEELLARIAASHHAHPHVVTALVKNRIVMIAKLAGEMVERKLAERELRDHQQSLEQTVKERTAEFERTNEQLLQEIEERRRAEELKDEFVSTVSHELRTPLAITIQGLGLLLDEIPGSVNEKQHKVLATASDNMDRLSRIINDLLDISKIEAGKMDLNKAEMEFESIANTVVASLEASAHQKGLTLETAFTLRNGNVFADNDRIIQVLTNLLNNAIKFTDEGRLRVSATNREKMVECCVEDTGIGLSQDEKSRVFDRFVQIGRTHGAGIKGTGLGLAIAKEICELHRGKLWVESEEGKGSRFYFTLPVYSESEVIREMVEEFIAEIRVEHEGFIFLLFELKLASDHDRGRQKFRKGFSNLFAMQDLVRASDRVMPRRGRQVVSCAQRLSLLSSARCIDVGKPRLQCAFIRSIRTLTLHWSAATLNTLKMGRPQTSSWQKRNIPCRQWSGVSWERQHQQTKKHDKRIRSRRLDEQEDRSDH